MRRWYAFSQLLLARFREFYREPEVIFWVYGFPLIMAVGLGIAFWKKKPEPPEVDVVRLAHTQEDDQLYDLLKKDGLRVEWMSDEEAQQRLRIGKTSLYVVPAPEGYAYHYDEAREDSLLARYRVDAVVQRWKGTGRPASDEEAGNAWKTQDVLMSEAGSRYIDFLMPGLMGLNLLGGGLFGVGFLIVDLRVRKLLKRYLATPMRRSDFLLSVLVGRMLFMLPEMLMLVVFGWLVFGVPIVGSVWTLGLVMFVGASAFSGLGLLVSARANKMETASGLINLMMLPMWLLCGTFFSSRRFPDWSQPFIQALPLTQVNDALREVMLEGQPLSAVAWRLAILIAWGGISFALGLFLFRWN